MDRRDLLVVGGGPAGLGVALEAASRGLSVVVVERHRPPLDKACGEGLMPPAVQALQRLGVSLPAWGCHPFEGIRYLDGPLCAEGRFPSGQGAGVRRLALAEAMRQRAEQLGADLRFGARLVDWHPHGAEGVEATVVHGGTTTPREQRIHARVLVGADGLHSAVRARANLALVSRGAKRFGVRRHFAMAPWSDFVEVHWANGVEAYVTPVGPRLVGVALLWRVGVEGARGGRRQGSSGEPLFQRLLAHFPRLVERLEGMPTASAARGAGPFRQRARRCYAGRVALVGDAAGYLDPITGEGVSLALRAARLLVETVAEGRPLAAYERAFRPLYRHYAFVARLALLLARRPPLRRRVIGTLARRPDLFSQLIGINAGQLPLHTLGLRQVAPLLAAAIGMAPRDRATRA